MNIWDIAAIAVFLVGGLWAVIQSHEGKSVRTIGEDLVNTWFSWKPKSGYEAYEEMDRRAKNGLE